MMYPLSLPCYEGVKDYKTESSKGREEGNKKEGMIEGQKTLRWSRGERTQY